MKSDELRSGEDFWCNGRRWRGANIGMRVIAAISVEPHEVVEMGVKRDVAAPTKGRTR